MVTSAADGGPTRVWFALRPRDAVQVRDGRTVVAGAGGGAGTRRPWPSTVAGAVGAAFGQDDANRRAAAGLAPRKRGARPLPRTVRGPFLGRWDKSGQRWRLAFPLPADVVPAKRTPDTPGRRWTRLRLLDVPAVTDLGDGGGELLLHADDADGKADRSGQDLWWDADALREYLHSGAVSAEVLTGLMAVERRTGIALQERTAKHAHLYTSDFLRLREESDGCWEFLALCELDSGLAPPPRGPVRFGGEGRLADLRVCPEEITLPEMPDRFPGGRVLVYLATPAVWRRPAPAGAGHDWEDTWIPDLPENSRLVAAAVSGPEHVASASRETRGEHAYTWLRWAVPAGSVYLLRFTGADPEGAAQAWAARLHGRAWGERNAADRDGRTLATAGFGLALMGTWT